MAEPNEKLEKSLLSTLSGWVQLFIALVIAGGVLWAALMFFSPLKDVDLTVLIKQSIPIDVPDEAEYFPLQLNYDGNQINRATIIELKIENTGKTVIRPDKGSTYWSLNIITEEASRLILLGNIEPHPSIIQLNVEGNTHYVRLQIGKLNPGDFLTMKVIVIDPENPKLPALRAEATADHLSTPTVTTLPLRERFNDAFLVPLAICFGLLAASFLIYITWRESKESKSPSRKQVIENIITIILFTSAFSAVGGIIGSALLSWIAVWLIGR